jgi:hypothetical protein
VIEFQIFVVDKKIPRSYYYSRLANQRRNDDEEFKKSTIAHSYLQHDPACPD